MDALQGRLALITGAASGIGRATAMALARRGARLLLTDISAEGLSAVAEEVAALGSAAQTWVVDVGDLEAMRALADEVHACFGPLDILVNNAGVAVLGRFVDNSIEDIHWMTDVNLRGVVHGCALFLPQMVEAPGCASVVNVASAAAFGGVPGMAAYAMTKAAVLSLSEGIQAEHDRRSLHVAVICPGFVDTRIATGARYASGLGEGARSEAERMLGRAGRSPEVVAQRIVSAIEARRFLVPIFAEGWVALATARLPTRLAMRLRKLARAVADRRGMMASPEKRA